MTELGSRFADNLTVTEYISITETSLMSLDFIFDKLKMVGGTKRINGLENGNYVN